MKSRFKKPCLVDDRGALTPLMLVLLVGILVSSGIALDLIRQESERSDLQDALDRGVLAAASLTQTVDAQTTLTGYLANRSIATNDLTVAFEVDYTGNSRRVIAKAEYKMDTMFFRMVGLPQLPVIAVSSAAQRQQPVELSLVLDISGTMRFNDRLVNLQPAAVSFVDEVTSDSVEGLTTINLVPYAGQVNPGPEVFQMIGGRRDHEFSSCPEFDDADFDDSRVPNGRAYDQVPNFHHWRIDRDWMDWGWCPDDATAIRYLSTDPDALRSAINSIRLHDGTGTYNAMKWALTLLDPNSQDFVSDLVTRGIVPREVDGRPAPWDSGETLKIIVLMTDGQITRQLRPKNPRDPKLRTQEVDVYKHPHEQSLSRRKGLGFFYNLCDLAKENGVTVFTIAFEAPRAAREEMQNCASSAGHFFDVDGLEIGEAFNAIASTISRLKLVE